MVNSFSDVSLRNKSTAGHFALPLEAKLHHITQQRSLVETVAPTIDEELYGAGVHMERLAGEFADRWIA